MKICIFGKQLELRVEVVVIAASLFIILGCLAGYLFFSDDSDIIIEASSNAGNVSENASNGQDSPGDGDAEHNGKGAGALHSEEEDGGTELAEAGAGSVSSGAVESPDGKSKELSGTIKIYVVGCVRKPGIVTLQKGQLIDDAVRIAGGLTEEADAGSINMVYELNENLMLRIKSMEEMIKEKEIKKSAIVNKPVVDSGLGNGASIIRGSGEGVDILGDEGDGIAAGSDGGGINAVRVNINTADENELDTLPGVGSATAKDIIAFREKNGSFRKIEDIMKVPRIKKNRFESIKDFITVD